MAETRTPFEKRLWDIASSLRGVIDTRELPRLALLLLSTRAMALGERWRAKEEFPSWEQAMSDPTGQSLRDSLDIARFALSAEHSTDVIDDRILRRTTEDRAVLEAIQALARLLDETATDAGVERAADRVLEYARKQGGVQSGEHMSPPDLRQLVARLVAQGTGTEIYDPACGTAGLLIEVCREIARNNPDEEPQPSGQELSSQTASVARMNLFLHGFDASEIRTGNTLSQPTHVDEDQLRVFDRIATVLPMGMRLPKEQQNMLTHDRHRRFRFVDPGSSAEVAFLQHIVSSLRPGGTAAVVLSSGFLFRVGRERQLREALIRLGYIRTVISLPPLLPGTGARPALLLLARPVSEGEPADIQFVSADGLYSIEGRQKALSEPAIDEIVSVVKSTEDSAGVSASVAADVVLMNDASLVPARYTVQHEAAPVFGDQTQVVRLGDIATIARGARVKIAKEPAGGTPVLRGRDLRQVSLSPEDLAEVLAEGDLSEVPRVEEGDVLVQRIGEHPAAMCVEGNLSGTIPADSVVQIRLAEDHQALAPFLVDYLNSDPGQAALAARIRGTAAPYVHTRSLEDLPVPMPNRDVVRLVQGLRGIESELVERVARTRSIREKLFSQRDREEARSELASLDAEQQALAASLLRVDEPLFRIRNFYPYPLAFPYRMLDPISDCAERYRAQLALVESILAYLGSLGLALLAYAGGASGEGSHPLSIESLQSYWRGGISPGDWQSIGRETGRALKDLGGDQLCVAFAGLWFKGRGTKESDFARRAAELVELKNDYKHDRGPKTPPEFEDSAERLQELLDGCFGDLSFAVAHPLYLTEASEVDPMTKEVTIPILKCIGDHPAFDRERHPHDVALPGDTLFARAAADDWARLFPLVTVQYCPTCKNREFFAIDRWDGTGGRMVLKSLERGHTMDSSSDDPRVAAAVRNVSDCLDMWLRDLEAPPDETGETSR